MIAVSDTGPLNYLVLIGAADILGVLFDQVLLPYEVFSEFQHRKTPGSVATWLKAAPEWLTIVPVDPHSAAHQSESLLSQGTLTVTDLACIELAQRTPGCVLLVDDWVAKEVAMARGVRTSGILAVLFKAGESGLLDFGDALTRLEQTTFRASTKIRAHYRQQWENLGKAKP